MMGNETDEILEELFQSLLQRCQKDLEEKIRGSEFVFDCIDLLYYKLHKISLNKGGLYINSPEWIKNKSATINIKNNDDKCFHYAITAALNSEQVKSHPERISKIKSVIEQYNWKEINFPSQKKDWEKFEKKIK